MMTGSDKQEVASTLDALVRQEIQRIRNKSHENSQTYKLSENSRGTVVWSV